MKNDVDQKEQKDTCACAFISGKKNPAFKRHSEYECANDEAGLLIANTNQVGPN